jgi:hypothetical protein
MPQMPGTLYGCKIFVSPDRPKMQLSPDCPVTDDFRAEINAWMIEFFGVTNLIPDGHYIQMKGRGEIHMNPRTYAEFEKAFRNHTFPQT